VLNIVLAGHEFLLRSLFSALLKTGRSPYNFKKSDLMHKLKSLLDTQWLSQQEVEAIQVEKARRLLTHAYDYVPYYRKTFDEAGFNLCRFRYMDQISVLPVLTKRIIQDEGTRLISKFFTADRYNRNSTGGSTGHPLTFWQSHEYEAWGMADIWRNFYMCGHRPGERKAFFWGSDYDAARHKGFRERFFKDLLRENMLWINTFNLSQQLLERSVKQLVRFKPRLIVAYVSSITLLARYIQETGIKGIHPGAIQTSAEVLTVPQRRLLEDVFQCQVFDRYGCREVGNIAHECDAHEGLHLLSENNYTEFVIDGEKADVGETGLITVTNLNNLAMPFIRYQPGDLGRPAGRSCSCGRGLPLMEMVDGRSTDVIVSPSGRFLHGEFFTHLFYKIDDIRQFQVVQKERDLLVVSIVPMSGCDCDGVFSYLAEIITTHADSKFRLEFRTLDSIPPVSSGKYRFVYSEIAAETERRHSLNESS
jgi:phenylacetate-CoA ligase